MKCFHRYQLLTFFFGLLIALFSIRNIAYLLRTGDKRNDGEDPVLNRTWLKMRENCLRETRVTRVFLFSYMRGGSTLFSEIFNQDPTTDVMWYEPMDAFYQSYAGFEAHSIPLTILYYKNSTPRYLTYRERIDITEYMASLLTCRIEQLPIETFAHNYYGYSTAFRRSSDCMTRKHAKRIISNCISSVGSICGNTDLIRRDMLVAAVNKCPEIIRALKSTLPNELTTKDYLNLNANHSILNITRISNLVQGFSKEDKQRLNAFVDCHMCKAKARFILANCMDTIESTCKRARLIALKVIRSRMKDMEMLIQRIPDIHVLYYTRDPRAIVISRLSLPFPLVFSSDERSVTAESKILCHRMWEDIKAKKLLERKYPGSITTIRYEDFVQDFSGTIEFVFSQMKHNQSQRLWRWILRKRTADADDKPFSTFRGNSCENISKWKTKVSVSQEMEMNRHCHKVLLELGYDL